MNLLRAGSSLHTETFVWFLWAYEKCQLATIKPGHVGCNGASRDTSGTKFHARHNTNRCLSKAAMTAHKKEVYIWSQILPGRKADQGTVSESIQRKVAEVHSGWMYVIH